MTRRKWHLISRFVISLCLVGGTATERPAQAATSYALERYRPTRPGEDTFWVDAPSAETLGRRFALGMTADYDNKPLVVRQTSGIGAPHLYAVIRHELVAHVQGAMSFAHRFILSADLPVVLVHRGDPLFAVKPGAEISQGDLRVGGLVSLFKHAEKRATNLFVSADLFVPLRGRALSGDRLPQLAPKVILTQKLGPQFTLSTSLGALVREKHSISLLPNMPGNTSGSEIQAGVRLALANPSQTWSVGPELVAATTVVSESLFKHDGSSVEILGGVHWAPHPAWRIGAGLGAGLLASPGTPLFRGLLRVSFAPPSTPPASTLPPPTWRSEAPIPPPPPPVVTIPEPVAAPVLAPEPAPTAQEEIALEDIAPTAPIVIKKHSLVVPTLEFQNGSAKLIRRSEPIIRTLVKLLKGHPEIKRVVIEAHTDNVGQPDINRHLSRLRAKAIRKILILNGIAPRRLESRGLGSSRPKVENDSEIHRQMNRRVEFKIHR